MKKIFLLLLFGCAASPAFSQAFLKIGAFSSYSGYEEFQKNWTPLKFEKIEKLSKYFFVKEKDGYVVKAVTNNSASGMVRKVEIDLNEFPILEWDWKVLNIYEKGNVREKSGDDYPARIYITFKYNPDKAGFFEKVKFKAVKIIYGEYPPVSAINYIFASKAKKNLVVSNPYINRVKMIVVDSGINDTGKWIHHRRNVLEDYKKAFGDSPPLVSGVAIMSDSDNTGESGVAYYGDIIFKKK